MQQTVFRASMPNGLNAQCRKNRAAGAAPAAGFGPGADTAASAPPQFTPPQAARPPDEDAIDLLSVAGFPVIKRVLPVAGAVAVLLTLFLLGRRRRRRRA